MLKDRNISMPEGPSCNASRTSFCHVGSHQMKHSSCRFSDYIDHQTGDKSRSQEGVLLEVMPRFLALSMLRLEAQLQSDE
jgi:hypothetical protein